MFCPACDLTWFPIINVSLALNYLCLISLSAPSSVVTLLSMCVEVLVYTWEGLIFHSCLHSIYVGGRLLHVSSQQSLMHRKQCLQECCNLIMLIYNCLYLKSDKSKCIIFQLLVGIFFFKQRVDWGRFNILNVLVLSNISQCNLILQSFSSKMYHCSSPLNQFRSDCAI